VLRLIAVTALLSACAPSINGVPVDCAVNITDAECVNRATVALQSLPPEHPPVSRVVVTCDPDPERARRAMEAMLKMGKIEVDGLRAAADGR
jgi:hypothetical protein